VYIFYFEQLAFHFKFKTKFDTSLAAPKIQLPLKVSKGDKETNIIYFYLKSSYTCYFFTRKYSCITSCNRFVRFDPLATESVTLTFPSSPLDLKMWSDLKKRNETRWSSELENGKIKIDNWMYFISQKDQ